MLNSIPLKGLAKVAVITMLAIFTINTFIEPQFPKFARYIKGGKN